MQNENILVWLPSPLGDAVLCTPALRALRKRLDGARIFFFAKPTVRQVLDGLPFCDQWIEQTCDSPFGIAKQLAPYDFSHAILFKNSFASALAVFLARIPVRIGYCRQGRGFLLTERLHPSKEKNGKFKMISVLDYYLAIASWLGCETDQRTLSLAVDPTDMDSLKNKLPDVVNSDKPLIILVPGGAFGPSKCWPCERFGQTANYFIENYNANVVISVAPSQMEIEIANQIAASSKYPLINLAERHLSLGQLKALFSLASLVITNDTGPRHIAIALKRKLVTLFGPNAPQWTETDYPDEIKIVGIAPCVPCGKSHCTKPEHLCMESISSEMVCQAAKKLLEADPSIESPK